jgi:hypothetical protein
MTLVIVTLLGKMMNFRLNKDMNSFFTVRWNVVAPKKIEELENIFRVPCCGGI